MSQNYVTLRNFGAYKIGSVLPEWAIARAGSVEEHVARGIVKPTDAPVNVDVKVKEPKVATDVSPEVVNDANALRRECASLAESNKDLVASVRALQESLKARDKELGKQTEDIAHLTEACAAHQAARDDLMAKLEAAKAENAKLLEDMAAATVPANAPPAPKPKPAKAAGA